MGATESSIGRRITDQEINIMLQWDNKRYRVYDDIQDLYKQLEACQNEHLLMYPLYCRSYLTRIHRREL